MDRQATSEANYGEEDLEATDREWEEFAKLVKSKNKRQEQAFYPCPPPEEDYVSTVVSGISVFLLLLHFPRV